MALASITVDNKIPEFIDQLNAYAKATSRDPANVLQSRTKNLLVKLRQEFYLEKATKQRINIDVARVINRLGGNKRKKGPRGSSGLRLRDRSLSDFTSGRALGLRIRESVVNEGKKKFKFAESDDARYRKFFGAKGKQAGKPRRKTKKTIRRDGKQMTFPQWLISREAAVRRGGIAYLQFGFIYQSFKSGDQPRTREISKRNKGGKFVGSLKQLVKPDFSAIQIRDQIAGTVTVNKRKGIVGIAVKRAIVDMQGYLIRRQERHAKGLFKKITGLGRS